MESYTSNTLENANPSENNSRPPRPTVIIEFVEGDLSKLTIYPNGGSFEADEAIRAEVERRWAAQLATAKVTRIDPDSAALCPHCGEANKLFTEQRAQHLGLITTSEESA